jgi:hypothetical protein
MANTKEIKVFICNISEFEDYSKTSISADIISELDDHQELKETFIELAERTGMVYSLIGFQNAINNEELNFTESYIFITNNY